MLWLKLLLASCCFLASPKPAAMVCTKSESYNACQCPEGDTAYLRNTSTKIIFRISSEDFVLNTHRLRAVLNNSTITAEIRRTEDLPCAVVYNLCKNSDEPEMTCMESQVTIWGKQVPVKQVSFDLYKGTDRIKRLFTFTLLPLPEGKTAAHCDITLTDTNTRQGHSNATTFPITSNQSYSSGLVAAAVLAGLFGIAFTLTLVALIIVIVLFKNKGPGRTPSSELTFHPPIHSLDQTDDDSESDKDKPQMRRLLSYPL